VAKLLAFVACEKVILDQRSNTVSLVGLLQNLNINLESSDVPEHVAIPLRWEIFSLWMREEDDTDRRYVLEISLVSPDGKPLFVNSVPIVFEKTTHRSITTAVGFPIAGSGRYSVLLSLREDVEGSGRREVGAYPIDVVIGLAPAEEPPAGTTVLPG